MSDWKIILGPSWLSSIKEVVLAISLVLIWSDSQGDGPALSIFKPGMKGQSCPVDTQASQGPSSHP